MKKYIMIAGLLLGLACFAQTATTPGTPSPHDPNYQGNTVPNASTQQYPPDQQSPDDRSGDHNRDQDRDRTSSDQQQYPDTPSTPDARDNRHDRDSQTTDQDHHDQSGDMDRDRNSGRDRQPQSDQTSRQDDHDHHDMGDRNDRAYGDADHDRDRDGAGSGYGQGSYREQIRSALQQANLSDVQVSDAGSRIQLTGTVPTGRDRRNALKIAQSYAHGREVVDNIQVSGRGHDRDDQR
jgi:hypothetical protein